MVLIWPPQKKEKKGIVPGPKGGSLGASFVAVDWKLMVFMTNGIVNRLSVNTDHSSFWVHLQALLLHSIFFSRMDVCFV